MWSSGAPISVKVGALATETLLPSGGIRRFFIIAATAIITIIIFLQSDSRFRQLLPPVPVDNLNHNARSSVKRNYSWIRQHSHHVTQKRHSGQTLKASRVCIPPLIPVFKPWIYDVRLRREADENDRRLAKQGTKYPTALPNEPYATAKVVRHHFAESQARSYATDSVLFERNKLTFKR